MTDLQAEPGHLRQAPESFLSPALVNGIQESGVTPSRRKLLQGALALPGSHARCKRHQGG